MDARCAQTLELAEKDFPQSLIVRCSKGRAHAGMHLCAEPIDWTYRRMDGSGARLLGFGEFGWSDFGDHIFVGEKLGVFRYQSGESVAEFQAPNFVFLNERAFSV